MSDKPLISVVIPVYKVEEYLNECVDSVTSQTYSNLEIILVDDGSPDSCPKICDQYKAQDSRIRVLHKANGGLSSARNAGTDIATGRYITFIDSDDYVSSDYIRQLYITLIDSKARISACKFSQKAASLTEGIITAHRIYTPKEAIMSAMKGGCTGVERTACAKLYDIGLFTGGIRYPEEMTCEDLAVMPEVFVKSGGVALADTIKYFYRQRESSIINSDFSIKDLDYYTALQRAREYACAIWPELDRYFRLDCISHTMRILRSVCGASQSRDIPYDKITADLIGKVEKRDIPAFMFWNVSPNKKLMVIITAFMPKLGMYIYGKLGRKKNSPISLRQGRFL